MASTFTPNIGLEEPAFGDPNWNIPIVANLSDLDSMTAIGGLGVRPSEIPSVTLNVNVAPGDYPHSDGSKGTYAGIAGQAVPPSATTLLWLDSTGVLTLGSSYPTALAHVPIAAVVAGSSAISLIVDNRVPGGLVLRTLGNYASDGAAAAGGVSVGGFYRTGNAVQVRIA